jgi:hypothetical protein
MVPAGTVAVRVVMVLVLMIPFHHKAAEEQRRG